MIYNKIAIYTAIIGDYDIIRQPEIIDERFDYIIFSDNIKTNQIGVWRIRPIHYYNKIQTKIARWVKTHPELLLSDYSCSIWIDANIIITSNFVYQRSISLYEGGVDVASVSHPDRQCTYMEGVTCMFLQLDSERNILPWLRKLHIMGYPENAGLWETNILFRSHKRSVQFDNIWWSIIDKYSKRDQLSFGYALWKTRINCVHFLNKGESARNSSHFKYIEHHSKPIGRTVPINNRDFPFLNRYKSLNPYKNIDNYGFKKKYCLFYKAPFPLAHAWLYGILYFFYLKIKTKVL